MCIVIDMQHAQIESENREIICYNMLLLQSIIRNKGKYDISLALDSNFLNSIAYIRKIFREVLPPENIRVCVIHFLRICTSKTAILGNKRACA
ncbi:hypothetical protein AGMMS49925_02730 [Deltaproteobacteria bacterium]|nr:hypothetical protein AGMMS49925_02730 [Deltaproteobacteria bacterium]